MRRVIEGEELSSQVKMATEKDIAIIADADIKSVVIDRFEGNPLVIFMNCWFLGADFSRGFLRLIFVDCELDVCNFDTTVLECFQFAPFDKLISFRTVWWHKYEGQELVQRPTYISSCSFVGARMTRATRRDAHIGHCDFARADLSQATGIELH